MLNNEENVEKLEREFIIKEYNFESCIEQIYYKYKLIFQITIICLSLILIIIPFPEKSKAQISSPVEPTEQIKPVIPEITDLPKKINEPEPLVNLYIIAHKDFSNNAITNPAYKILCDKRTQLTKNYNLEIIETYKDLYYILKLEAIVKVQKFIIYGNYIKRVSSQVNM